MPPGLDIHKETGNRCNDVSNTHTHTPHTQTCTLTTTSGTQQLITLRNVVHVFVGGGCHCFLALLEGALRFWRALSSRSAGGSYAECRSDASSQSPSKRAREVPRHQAPDFANHANHDRALMSIHACCHLEHTGKWSRWKDKGVKWNFLPIEFPSSHMPRCRSTIAQAIWLAYPDAHSSVQKRSMATAPNTLATESAELDEQGAAWRKHARQPSIVIRNV